MFHCQSIGYFFLSDHQRKHWYRTTVVSLPVKYRNQFTWLWGSIGDHKAAENSRVLAPLFWSMWWCQVSGGNCLTPEQTQVKQLPVCWLTDHISRDLNNKTHIIETFGCVILCNEYCYQQKAWSWNLTTDTQHMYWQLTKINSSIRLKAKMGHG